MRRLSAGIVVPAVFSAAITLVCASAGSVADGAEAQAGKKTLHTIPEDGIGNAGGMRPNKMVRDLMAAHPGEEVIICVAGCFDNRDRVVYARPIEVWPSPEVPAAALAPEQGSFEPAAAEATPAADEELPRFVPTAGAEISEAAVPAASEPEAAPQEQPSDGGDAPASDAEPSEPESASQPQ